MSNVIKTNIHEDRSVFRRVFEKTTDSIDQTSTGLPCHKMNDEKNNSDTVREVINRPALNPTMCMIRKAAEWCEKRDVCSEAQEKLCPATFKELKKMTILGGMELIKDCVCQIRWPDEINPETEAYFYEQCQEVFEVIEATEMILAELAAKLGDGR